MAAPGFLNENTYRSFPFVAGSVGVIGASVGAIAGLPDATIVDAGFIMGLAAQFDPATDYVQLSTVTRTGSTLKFIFTSNAPGLFGTPLIFTRHVSDGRYLTEYADTEAESTKISDSLYASDIPCETEPLWNGYLITGDLAPLLLLLPGNGSLTASGAEGTIEPALIQNLDLGYVSGINVVNQDRTRVTSPVGCPAIVWPYTIGRPYIDVQCLRGDVRLIAGHNCNISQDTPNNTITISGVIGAGTGQPCAEIPLFTGETPPPGSHLLSGGPRCNQVLRTINGVGGTFATLLAGIGVLMTPDAGHHTINIDVNMSQMVTCYSQGLLEISESL